MKKHVSTLIFLLSALLIAGCSSTPIEKVSPQTSHPADLTNSASIKTALYRQQQQWQGTHYQWGGLSKKGVDCSGLVYLTYLNKLGTPIPRTTAQQAMTGEAIQRGELKAGDLVFFKTSEKVRHVGIYIEEGKFLHASTQKGVMISRLNDYYWKDKYWYARRVIF